MKVPFYNNDVISMYSHKQVNQRLTKLIQIMKRSTPTVVPTKSERDGSFCLKLLSKT